METRIERRRFHDNTPRCTYAQASVINNTKIVSRNGYAHCALLALGWSELIVEPDFVLLQAPSKFGEEQ